MDEITTFNALGGNYYSKKNNNRYFDSENILIDESVVNLINITYEPTTI